jgi:uncharacterized RDD family membrane protein YckC
MRRSDNEPLLFDLPLDRPPRDDESEPLLERPPHPPNRQPRSQTPPQSIGRTAPDPQADAGAPGAARGIPVRAARPSPTAAPARQDPRSAAAAAPARSAALGQRELMGMAGSGDLSGPAAAPPGIAGQAAGLQTSQQAGARSHGRAGIGRRAAGGAADLLIHLAVGVLALAGCRYLGVEPVVRDWPALAVFLLSFSFLYTVVPLAFWGHTLGMTWAGLTSQSIDGEPLSFDQTARRWLGSLLTLATLGLPLLFALGGRSLADRLSGSLTSLTATALTR